MEKNLLASDFYSLLLKAFFLVSLSFVFLSTGFISPVSANELANELEIDIQSEITPANYPLEVNPGDERELIFSGEMETTQDPETIESWEFQFHAGTEPEADFDPAREIWLINVNIDGNDNYAEVQGDTVEVDEINRVVEADTPSTVQIHLYMADGAEHDARFQVEATDNIDPFDPGDVTYIDDNRTLDILVQVDPYDLHIGVEGEGHVDLYDSDPVDPFAQGDLLVEEMGDSETYDLMPDSTVLVQAVPADRYEFVGWDVDDAIEDNFYPDYFPADTQALYRLEEHEDGTVEAQFEQYVFDLTIEKEGEGEVHIDETDGTWIEMEDGDSRRIEYEDIINLRASDAHMFHWEDGNSNIGWWEADPEDAELDIGDPADHLTTYLHDRREDVTITAVFTEAGYSVEIDHRTFDYSVYGPNTPDDPGHGVSPGDEIAIFNGKIEQIGDVPIHIDTMLVSFTPNPFEYWDNRTDPDNPGTRPAVRLLEYGAPDGAPDHYDGLEMLGSTEEYPIPPYAYPPFSDPDDYEIEIDIDDTVGVDETLVFQIDLEMARDLYVGQSHYENRWRPGEGPAVDEPIQEGRMNLHIDDIGSVYDREDNDDGIDPNESHNLYFTNMIRPVGITSWNQDASKYNLPEVLVAESDDIPVLSLQYASSDQEFMGLDMLFQEVQGLFIPGGGDLDSFGDIEYVNVYRVEEGGRPNRDDRGNLAGQGFDPDDDDVDWLMTVPRYKLPSDPDEPFDFTAHRTELSSRYRTGVSARHNLVNHADDNFEYYLVVTLETNRGWGEPDEVQDYSNYFGFGDAFTLEPLSVSLENPGADIGTIAPGDPMNEFRTDPMYQSINIALEEMEMNMGHGRNWDRNWGEIDKFDDGFMLDALYGDPMDDARDTMGLDFSPDMLLGIVAVGNHADGDYPAELQSITLEFPNTSDDFTPRTDLRDLHEGKQSGLQVWFNREFNNIIDVHQDVHLPLSSDRTRWKSDTEVVLELKDGFYLPSKGDFTRHPEADRAESYIEKNRGIYYNWVVSAREPRTTENWWTRFSRTPTIFIAGLTDWDEANYGENFTVRIAEGGLEFADGKLVEGERPRERYQRESHTFYQGVKTSFKNMVVGDTNIGPNEKFPVLGINTFAESSDDINLSQVDFYAVRPDTPGGLTRHDLNPLANSDTSGAAIYLADEDGNPDWDKRLPLDLGSSDTESGMSAGTERGMLYRLVIDNDAARPDNLIPETDSGDESGINYVLVLHTSERIDRDDKFKVIMGDLDKGDGVRPRVEYRYNDGTVVSRTFAKGDWDPGRLGYYPADLFYTRLMMVERADYFEFEDATGREGKLRIDFTGWDRRFNKEDPAFDPTRGEAMEIDSSFDDTTIDISVYTISGELVYEGWAYGSLHWDGRTNSGDLVNNGAYIVRLEADGVGTKAFPVMVVK